MGYYKKLTSAIYNDTVSGLRGYGSNSSISMEQIEDDIINERLAIIKEYSLKGILPADDLMIKINCIELDDQPVNRINEFESFDTYYIKHFEIPQIAYAYGKESVGYIGPINGRQSFTVYTDRNAWVNH